MLYVFVHTKISLYILSYFESHYMFCQFVSQLIILLAVLHVDAQSCVFRESAGVCILLRVKSRFIVVKEVL